ncbi:hypothetical protein [Ectobacillus ponti]|uniref:Uncharacterized protein n=1 Tax=Ectobacillus ponti TaxID=2961894 RepID=A0AA41X4S8_9BACI|nr:hypothetical protein [Ectobacillus ponti]MCP8968707.1 hypothetical protein [Ectobacillus ponti]
MRIKEYKGYELVKAQSNTSEDYFNRSEVTYIADGEERTLHVLYIRFFEEQLAEFTPFAADPVLEAAGEPVTFKEIVALACLLKDPALQKRKRLYFNTKEELGAFFDGQTIQAVQQVVAQVKQNGSAEYASALS